MTESLTAFGSSVLAFVWFGQARWRESVGKGKKRALFALVALLVPLIVACLSGTLIHSGVENSAV